MEGSLTAREKHISSATNWDFERRKQNDTLENKLERDRLYSWEAEKIKDDVRPNAVWTKHICSIIAILESSRRYWSLPWFLHRTEYLLLSGLSLMRHHVHCTADVQEMTFVTLFGWRNTRLSLSLPTSIDTNKEADSRAMSHSPFFFSAPSSWLCTTNANVAVLHHHRGKQGGCLTAEWRVHFALLIITLSPLIPRIESGSPSSEISRKHLLFVEWWVRQ